MKLGLTRVCAKIYLSLIEIGVSKVERITEISHISRPDVYRNGKKLQEIGLIECVISKPVMFEAVPPKIVINGLLKKKRKDLKELEAQSEKLLSELEKKYMKRSCKDSDYYVFVPSHEALISRLNEEINKAKKNIEIVTTCNRLQYACYCFSESLKKAWKRNVKCRVIIEQPSLEQKLIFRKCYPKPWADIRFLSEKPSTVVAIFDKSEVFIMTRSNTALKESSALWSNNIGIISISCNYLETLWEKSSILEGMIFESPVS